MPDHLQYTSMFIRSLYQQGVRHAVISPGSRSTPLAIAAAIHPGIERKVVLDERSAAFIALGIGKSTGKPAILICTSGTAVANYYPAVIEAKESGVPLIILSADRPPANRGVGSSQTIDQVKIFGDHVLFFHDVGEPKDEPADIRRIQLLGRQSVDITTGQGGPVHINFPFRKPLEPSVEVLNEQILLSKKQFEEKPGSFPAVANRTIHLSPEINRLISTSQKPLIICGPANPMHSLQNVVRTMADKLQAPVIMEPGSSMGRQEDDLLRYEQYLRAQDARKELKPDLIIRFGDQPFTKSLLTVLDEWNNVITLHISAREGVQDHAMSVDHHISCKPTDNLDLSDPHLIRNRESNWLMRWQEYELENRLKLNRVISDVKAFTDGHVFHHLSQKIDDKWNVMLSNSFPARDMALFGSHSRHQYVNRGAAGIDGIISTAIGLNLSGNSPTCCIIGDLAFLHDSNALLSIKNLPNPFLIVVINNGGGTIFRMLPIADMNAIGIPDNLYQHYFETPQESDIQKLADANGIGYMQFSNLNELEQFDPESVTGSLIAECVTDADQSMLMRQNLWQK